jgi:N-acetylglucosaminyl-diphospho-decaprenol L-rhamnosyltransferase
MEQPSLNAVDVVIVHYHAADAVRDAVAALFDDARSSALPLRVIVADNGSTGDERTLLRSLPVTYFANGTNAGYAGAINAAFAHTSADFVVVMNEDVLVLPGCLRALREALQSGAAVAGPELYWDRDCTLLLPCTEERTRRNELLKISARGSLAALSRARTAWREHARRHWRSDVPIFSSSLSGAMLAFRRDTWTTVGPFDDAFRLYYEENDWLLRVAGAGLRSLYVPAAKAIHLHNPASAQSEERCRWEGESFVRFGNRHYGEHFMRRLLLASGRDGVVPSWGFADVVVSEISAEATTPLWLEVSPSLLGFPAAAARIDERPTGAWPLLHMRGLEHVSGPLYLQIVDDEGRELLRGTWASVSPDDLS